MEVSFITVNIFSAEFMSLIYLSTTQHTVINYYCMSGTVLEAEDRSITEPANRSLSSRSLHLDGAANNSQPIHKIISTNGECPKEKQSKGEIQPGKQVRESFSEEKFKHSIEVRELRMELWKEECFRQNSKCRSPGMGLPSEIQDTQ